MAMRLERLYCSACNAPLRVDTELREGDVITCIYCGASFVLSGNGIRSTKVTHTVKRNVVNNYYYVQRHSHNHYYAPTSFSPSYDFGTGGQIGLTPNQRWAMEHNEKTRIDKRRAIESQHSFCAALETLLLALLAATFFATLVPAATGSKTACAALLATEFIGLLLVHAGMLELKPESMELAQDEARTPLSSKDARGMEYTEVVNVFQSASFEDIRFEGLHDLGFLRRHFSSQEGLVTSVRIAHSTEFDKGEIFRKTDIVKIRYHSAKYPLIARLFQK